MHVELVIAPESGDPLVFAKGTEDLAIPDEGEVITRREQAWLVRWRHFHYFELDDGRDRLVVTLFASRTQHKQAAQRRFA